MVTVHNLPEEQQRWYAVKLFERDEKVLSQLNLGKDVLAHIEKDIQAAEKELDDEFSIAYSFIASSYAAAPIFKRWYPSPNRPSFVQSVTNPPTVETEI